MDPVIKNKMISKTEKRVLWVTSEKQATGPNEMSVR